MKTKKQNWISFENFEAELKFKELQKEEFEIKSKQEYKEVDNIKVADWAYTSIKEVRDEMRLNGTDKEEGYLFFGFHEFYVDKTGRITQI